jgi:hypothetical protein
MPELLLDWRESTGWLSPRNWVDPHSPHVVGMLTLNRLSSKDANRRVAIESGLLVASIFR